jgi:hypothetical protein
MYRSVKGWRLGLGVGWVAAIGGEDLVLQHLSAFVTFILLTTTAAVAEYHLALVVLESLGSNIVRLAGGLDGQA